MIIDCHVRAMDGAPLEAQIPFLAAFLETFVECNRLAIRAGRIPPLYQSGVRFQEDARWQDALSMLETHYGDCKDLVGWRLAELREVLGIEARLHVVMTRGERVDVIHMQVKHPSGDLEDPAEIVRAIAARGSPTLAPGGIQLVSPRVVR